MDPSSVPAKAEPDMWPYFVLNNDTCWWRLQQQLCLNSSLNKNLQNLFFCVSASIVKLKKYFIIIHSRVRSSTSPGPGLSSSPAPRKKWQPCCTNFMFSFINANKYSLSVSVFLYLLPQSSLWSTGKISDSGEEELNQWSRQDFGPYKGVEWW